MEDSISTTVTVEKDITKVLTDEHINEIKPLLAKIAVLREKLIEITGDVNCALTTSSTGYGHNVTLQYGSLKYTDDVAFLVDFDEPIKMHFIHNEEESDNE